MTFWHLPAIANRVMMSPGLRAVEIASLLIAGAMFWRPLLDPAQERRMKPVPHALIYLVSACIACTVMGVLITFAPFPLYMMAGHSSRWAMDPHLDQQVGGVLMWTGCCAIYVSSAMAQFARWYAQANSEEEEWTAARS
jgi:cytochrome c oxidase assembly factor CtaG